MKPPAAWAGSLSDLRHIIGDRDSVVVADDRGNMLFSLNGQKKLVPASTLKILTSLVALHYLGPTYRFPTEFYLDEQKNLKVKGYGDPLLISEVLMEIAGTIATTVTQFNDLILDDTYFSHPVTIPGVSSSLEPYDAPNGSLCVNFNTVNFKKNSDGRYESAEPQTPLLPVVLNRITSSQLDQCRIVLSAQEREFVSYAGQLIYYFLNQRGVQSSGRVNYGQVNEARDVLILRYYSNFSLEDIVMKLLDHSNNFMANQIMIASGVKVYGPPGTLEKGVRVISDFTKNVLKIEPMQIAEGSGISRGNRISAHELIRVLDEFQPYHTLLPYRNGTFYKTGTLNGVRTQAGYINSRDKGLYRFVILLNTPGKRTEPIVEKIERSLTYLNSRQQTPNSKP